MEELTQFRNLLERVKLTTKNYRTWTTAVETTQLRNGLPLKVGAKAWRGVLLEEEVQLELGGVSSPSTAFTLCLPDLNLIHDGRITLVGPDLGQVQVSPCSFGLVALLCGRAIESQQLPQIRRTLCIFDEIEGFTQRSISRNAWFYVGKNLVERVASFEHIGRALMILFREKFPALIEGVEIAFFVGDTPAIQELGKIGERVSGYIRAAWQQKIAHYAKFRPDCDFEWECIQCDYHGICEEIRDIIKLREGSQSESENG